MREQLNSSGTYPGDSLDLSRMNSVMRHRLRNLCCGMKMALDRIADQTQGTHPGVGDSCAVMTSELASLLGFTERMDLLFDDLLPGEPLTLFQLLSEARSHFAEKFPFGEIQMDGPESSLTLTYGSLVLTALKELLNNAGEACGDGSVLMSWEMKGGLTVVLRNPKDSMLDEDLPTSPPEPFFTNRGRHDGLGLAVVERVCRSLDGSFSFDHTDGVVTTTMTIPEKHLDV